MRRLLRSRSGVALALMIVAVLDLSSPRACATTVVAIGTPDGIVIAADSKGVYTGRLHGGPVCKIVPIGSGFLAMLGMALDTDHGFNVPSIVSQSYTSEGTFADWIAGTEKVMKAALTIEVEHLKEDAKGHSFTLKNDGNILDLVFAKAEGKMFHLSVRRFHADAASGTVEMTTSIDYPSKEAIAAHSQLVIKLGQTGEIERYFSEHDGPSINTDSLKEMIENQAKATPDKVGAPVTILKIDSSGPKWVLNELGCPLTEK